MENPKISSKLKRKSSSPILRSLKCSLLNHSPQESESNLESSDSYKTVGEDLSFASRSSTQESKLTTQNTQSFRTRLEKKFYEIPQSQDLIEQRKNSKFEISFENCSPTNVDIGPFFGLPTKVKELMFTYRRIQGLYEWQENCLRSSIKNENVLISLPTSSGKTLVAEVLMLRKLLLYKKNALFILPFVSLVQEKVRGLSSLAVDLDFIVDEYAASKGCYPPKNRFKKNVIYIATIEKANSLIESLLENNRISEIGLVVVDEIHMITETGGRGARLESIITKLKHFAGNIQLISMSATVGNLEELATFLNASLFRGEFRPVPLTQYLKVENEIGVVRPNAASVVDLLEPSPIRFYHEKEKFSSVDPDQITPMVEGIIPQHSCLIFCQSKNNTQAVALLLSSCLSKNLLNHYTIAKKSLLAALKVENEMICPILRKTIPFGIAYHHSGLTDGERKLLEEGFLIGTLCCIVCTSTLAAGVNLPARRVIIRSPYIARDFLTKSRYQQMIGRAGRAGLDSMGESFLVAQPRDVPKVKELLMSANENCISRLPENDFKGLRDLIFSMLGIKMVKSISSALQLADQSLLALQAKTLGINLHSEVFKILENLRSQGFLRSQRDSTEEINQIKVEINKENLIRSGKLEENDSLIICRVGKAAVKGSVDLRWANRLYCDLVHARSNLLVHSHLHLLYLVTPYDDSGSVKCNPQTFYKIYFSLSKEEIEVAEVLGISTGKALKISMGSHPKELDSKVLSRFHVALLLHKIFSGKNLWEVSEMFQVPRGLVQQLFNATVSFAYSILYFCEELEELWAFKDLLSSFTKTLSICSTPEVTPLLALPAVKLGRAKMLYKAGFKTLTDIANSSPQDLAVAVDHMSHSVARQIISSAKMLLMEKVNSLQEEIEGMLKELN